MFTTEATWERPTRAPARYSSRRDRPGLARAISATVADWLTVTSSSTPSEPMMMPASSSPRRSRPGSATHRIRSSSPTEPVRWATPAASDPEHAGDHQRAEGAEHRDGGPHAHAVHQVHDDEDDHGGAGHGDQQRRMTGDDPRQHEEDQQDEAGGQPCEGRQAAQPTEPDDRHREQTRQQQQGLTSLVVGDVVATHGGIGGVEADEQDDLVPDRYHGGARPIRHCGGDDLPGVRPFADLDRHLPAALATERRLLVRALAGVDLDHGPVIVGAPTSVLGHLWSRGHSSTNATTVAHTNGTMTPVRTRRTRADAGITPSS